MAGVKGMKHRRPKTQAERDTYALAKIEQMLDDIRDGKLEVDKSRLDAMRVRYEKLRPSLSAVEQTLHDERDKLSLDELEAKMTAICDAQPGLLERLVAAKARASRGEPATIAVQQGPQEANSA